MKLKELLFSWQFLLLILSIIVSLIAIGPSFSKIGVKVTYVGEGDLKGNLEPGTVIYSAGMVGEEPSNVYKLEDILQYQGKQGYLILYTSKGRKTIKIENNSILNLSVEKTDRTNLKFGLDIEGGIRALLDPENATNTTLEEIISILDTRINIYGLRQAEFRKVEVGQKELIMVSIAGGTEREIRDLLSRKGNFQAWIPLKLEDGSSFKLGKYLEGENEKFSVDITNNTVNINGKSYKEGDRFALKGINFEVINLSLNQVVLNALVFESDDVRQVGMPPESDFFGKTQGGYKFQFGVIISRQGSKRFAEITQNLERSYSQRWSYLSSKIHFYIDEKEIDSLSISGDLQGKEVTNPVITGYGETEAEARKNRDRLKAILQSGDIPVDIKVVSIDRLNPTLGENYLYVIALAGIVAIFLVSSVVFVRYRNLKISLGVILTMFSEVIIILGFAAATQWNLSTLALAGIIAAIGFGVDDQILIIDETSKKSQKYSLKEGLKRAFFMIIGAGATTIFAMLPILWAGFTAYREVGGFAVTVIVGVLIGVLISRPAFARLVELVLIE